MYAMLYKWMSENNFQMLVLFSYHMGSTDQTQVTKFGNNHFYVSQILFPESNNPGMISGYKSRYSDSWNLCLSPCSSLAHHAWFMYPATDNWYFPSLLCLKC